MAQLLSKIIKKKSKTQRNVGPKPKISGSSEVSAQPEEDTFEKFFEKLNSTEAL